MADPSWSPENSRLGGRPSPAMHMSYYCISINFRPRSEMPLATTNQKKWQIQPYFQPWIVWKQRLQIFFDIIVILGW